MTQINITAGANSPESHAFRDILVGMYQESFFSNFGHYALQHLTFGLTKVLIFNKSADYLHEYGIHKLTRISPLDTQNRRHTSFCIVEINGRRRNQIVCSYILDPYHNAVNHLNFSETTNVKQVLTHIPLGFRWIKG